LKNNLKGRKRLAEEHPVDKKIYIQAVIEFFFKFDELTFFLTFTPGICLFKTITIF